jgi:hypothetical protein
MGLAMAGFCGGCFNPIDRLAGCDGEGGPQQVDEATAPIDIAAVAKSFSGDYTGTLTWSRTGATTPLAVSVARLEREPATEEKENCNSDKIDGYTIPMKVSVSSGDTLVMPPDLKVDLSVDTAGAFKKSFPNSFQGGLDAEALKAAGLSSPEWGSNFFPVVGLSFGAHDLTPQGGSVADQFDHEKMLGTVTFP